ncbi:MAG: DUF2721 domain-containing protein [Methylophilaceae bacterium]
MAVSISTVANAIQLAVAPVFLLTGIGAVLAVMATRLARVVDRYRALGELNVSETNKEMALLSRRARWVHWAISLSTVSALFVCIVIAALFIGSEIGLDPSRIVSLLFITAMLTLIMGLLCFLREIHLSTGVIENRRNSR